MELYTKLALGLGGSVAALGLLIFVIAAYKNADRFRRAAVTTCLIGLGAAIALDVLMVSSRAADSNSEYLDGGTGLAVTAPFYSTALIIGCWLAAWLIGSRNVSTTLVVAALGGIVGALLLGIGVGQAQTKFDELVADGSSNSGQIALPVVIFGILTVFIAGVGGAWIAHLADRRTTPGSGVVAPVHDAGQSTPPPVHPPQFPQPAMTGAGAAAGPEFAVASVATESSSEYRYNPPPNWPPAPTGWEPRPGWNPPAEFPEPPLGWVLWVKR